MADIVLVPTFARPEYLAVMLEHLGNAEGANTKTVLVAQDRHINERPALIKDLELTKVVIDQAKAKGKFASLDFIERRPHPYIGNPSNFLELYREAYTSSFDLIYLVEDDVLVAPDFFRWHEAVNDRADYFVTVGWHCVRNPEVPPSDDPTAYIESYRDYSSIGVCWKRDSLAPLVKHARPEYYRDMRNYLARAFPGSPIAPGQWTEQAGVITRLLHETKNRLVAWPSLRRCAHVGVTGYHRPNGFRFTGDLDKRVNDLHAAVYGNRITGMSHDFADDIEPLPVVGPWQPADLKVVQRVPYVEGKI